MNAIAQLSNFILWIVAGAVGLVSEGVRRIHSSMTDLQDENEERQEEIEQLRKHVGLNEELDGPSRIDEIENEIEEIGDALDRHETYWTGDPDDPSQLGALGNLYQIRRQLYKMERRDREQGKDNE